MNRNVILLTILVLVLTCLGDGFAATTHTIESGDTLWDLAAKHYGDPTLYPVLLEVNGIDNPRTIPNGRVIVIPDKSDMEKIARESDPKTREDLIRSAAGDSAPNTNVVPPADDSQTQSSYSGKDSESRSGKIDPNETGFSNILKGPKVSPDKLIKVDTPN